MTVGCFAHVLNLITKDICKNLKFAQCLKSCISILKELKNSHSKNGKWNQEWQTYAAEQNEKGVQVRILGLSLPTDTRWYAYVNMAMKIIKSQTVLKRLEARDVFEMEANIRNVKNQSFFSTVNQVCTLYNVCT